MKKRLISSASLMGVMTLVVGLQFTAIAPAQASEKDCPVDATFNDQRRVGDDGRVFLWILPNGPECVEVSSTDPVVDSNPISNARASGSQIKWDGNRSGTYTVVNSSNSTVCSGNIRSCDVTSNGSYTIKFGTHSKTVNVTGVKAPEVVVDSNPISNARASGSQIKWDGNRSGTYTVVNSSNSTVCSGNIRSCDVTSNGSYTIKFGTHSKTVNVTGVKAPEVVVDSNPISNARASGSQIKWDGNRSGTYTVVNSSNSTVCSGNIRSCDVTSNGSYTIKFGTHSKTVNVTGVKAPEVVVDSNPISNARASGSQIKWDGNRSGTYTVVNSSNSTVCSGNIRSCDVTSNGSYTIKFGTHSKTVNVTGVKAPEVVVDSNPISNARASGSQIKWDGNRSGTYTVVNSSNSTVCSGNIRSCDVTSNGSYTIKFGTHSKTVNVTGVQVPDPVVSNPSSGQYCANPTAGEIAVGWGPGGCQVDPNATGGTVSTGGNTNTGGYCANPTAGEIAVGWGPGGCQVDPNATGGTVSTGGNTNTGGYCANPTAGEIAVGWGPGGCQVDPNATGGTVSTGGNTNTGGYCANPTAGEIAVGWGPGGCQVDPNATGGTVSTGGNTNTGGYCANPTAGEIAVGWGPGGCQVDPSLTGNPVVGNGEGNKPFGLKPVSSGHDPRSMADCLGARANHDGSESRPVLPYITANCDLSAAGINTESAVYFGYDACSADINHTNDQTWIPLLGEQLGMVWINGVEVDVPVEKWGQPGKTRVIGGAEISDSLNGVSCEVTLYAMPGGFILWLDSGDIPVEGVAGSIPVATKRIDFWW